VAEHLVAVVERDPELRVRERLDDGALNLDDVVFSRHKKTRPGCGPDPA
jgi:hypothetical protein